MKIYVDKIPEDGIEIVEQLDPDKMSLGVDVHGIIFTRPIIVKARITKTGAEVFADVSLESPVENTCARCLAKLQDIFRKRFNGNYEVGPNDILELDEDIRQEIILDYPVKVICRPDCKGLCPNCGQNLNIAKCECK